MRRRFWGLLVLAACLVGLISPARGLASTPPAPLVLVYGIMGSTETWGTTVKFLEAKGYVKEQSLFVVDLNANAKDGADPGVLADTAYTLDQIRQIMKSTGASQVDLVGTSRGGLIVRLLAEGETSAMVRRAVTIDTPHQGVLPSAKLYAILKLAGFLPSVADQLVPNDLKAESDTIALLAARGSHFGDRRVPALTIGSTFQDGVDAALVGNDAFVSLESQLAWPGAKTLSFKIGPSAADIAAMLGSDFGALALATQVPHVLAVDQPQIQQAVYDFLTDPAAKAPARACEPGCNDYAALKGRWSEATVSAMLPNNLPYSLDGQGNRVFEATRPMTRAEFVYALAKAVGLSEKFGATDFADIRSHWSLGYVRAAVEAKLVSGLTAESFGPDKPLTRAQAATLVVRAKGYATSDAPSPFADAHGHWAEKAIAAAAAKGIIKGDGTNFRPDDPVTMEEAAVIISRAFAQ